MKRLWSELILAALHLAVWPMLASAQATSQPAQPGAPAPVAQPLAGDSRPADARDAARALARRIDQLINARLAEAELKPAPRAGDFQLGRRIHLDLIGRIPNLLEIRDFS